jgi:Amt family ammonium transporter
MNPIWLVIFGIGSLLLRAGFALQAAGSLRAKNSSAAIVRLIAETAGAALSFWAFGFAILFQRHNAWIGLDPNLLLREAPASAALEFFYMTICMIGTSVLAGAIAERSKFYVGVLASAVLAGIIFPIIGHWTWVDGGILRKWNFVDFGGATSIHLSSAIFSAIGVAVLGSRAGKYHRDGSASSIPGHSLPMLGAGVMLLLAGWFPYLLGCCFAHSRTPSQWDDIELGKAATKILLAGAGGIAGGLIYSHWRYRKPDLFFTFGGLLGGLVAISSGLTEVSSSGAIIIGVVAGILVPMVALLLDLNARLDDPIGLIAIHGVGAIWGILATAIFYLDISFTDHVKRFALQCGGLAAVIILSSLVATAFFLTLRQLKWLRVTDADEFDGLDIGEHDINSYPDFQQTTIKSYHLREA